MHEKILPHLTRQRRAQMDRKANHEGWGREPKLAISSASLSFHCHETNNTVNTKDEQKKVRKKESKKIRQKRITFQLRSRCTDWVQLSQAQSGRPPAAALTDRGNEGEESSWRTASPSDPPALLQGARRDPEQAIQRSAQGGAGLSTVIGYEHMADHTHSILSEPGFVFLSILHKCVHQGSGFQERIDQHVSIWFDTWLISRTQLTWKRDYYFVVSDRIKRS